MNHIGTHHHRHAFQPVPTFQNEMQSLMSMITGDSQMCNPSAMSQPSFMNGLQSQQGNNSLMDIWSELLSAQLGGPQVGMSTLQGNHELQNPNDFGGSNSSLQAPGSGTQAQVLPDGTLNVSIPQSIPVGTVAAGGFDCQGGGRGMFAAAETHNNPTTPLNLQFKDGNIIYNGKKIPFGNTGVVIKLPTGEEIGVGRNSSNDPNQIRWAIAGPGQQVPCSPPGATNLYTIEGGGLVASGVR